MTAPGVDWPQTLRDLRDQLDQALGIGARHAAGTVDAQQWADACAALAQSFAALRALMRATPSAHATPEVRQLLAEIGSRVQTLGELQGRLSGAARQALAQLLPQDDLQAYARLGRPRVGPGRGGCG